MLVTRIESISLMLENENLNCGNNISIGESNLFTVPCWILITLLVDFIMTILPSNNVLAKSSSGILPN